MSDEHASQHGQREVIISDLVGKPVPLVGRLPSRYLSHVTLVGLVAVVGFYGQSKIANTRLESLSATPVVGEYVAEAPPQADVLVKPAAPATLFANRPKQQTVIHVAREGDTVEDLAQRYDVTANTIRWANGVAPGEALPPGQPLVILPISGVIHVVQRGDTVDMLANRYHSDPQAIIEFNQLSEPNDLAPSAELVIPGGRKPDIERPQLASRAVVRPTPQPEPTSAPASEPTSESAPNAASAPAATEQANQPVKPIEYQVADGDTLFEIAGKFSVSPDSIVAANEITGDGDSLQVGQHLLIPPASAVLHTVQTGDSLGVIANLYSSQVEKIAQANGLDDPEQIQPGQVIVIPDGKVPEPTPVVVQAPSVPSVQHAVEEGESVVAVADRFGVDVQTVIRANALAEPYTIHPGQTLSIPGGNAQPRPVAVAAAQPAPAEPAPAPKAEPEPAPPPPPSSDGWKIVEIASKYLGYKYAWGGTTPAGFDCSGFVYYVFGQAEVYVPRDMFGQLGSGPRIAQNNLQPGDIVFFVNTYAPGLTHNGIYIGGGRFIHAADERKGVTVSNLSESYWAARYHGASRPW